MTHLRNLCHRFMQWLDDEAGASRLDCPGDDQ
jgi:hypothetical protein